jgi:hypothetical protein
MRSARYVPEVSEMAQHYILISSASAGDQNAVPRQN